MKKTKFPKRAKLITDGGFTRIIDIKEFTSIIKIPLLKQISISTPETNFVEMDITFECSFSFERATKTMAFYRQIGVVNLIK